MLQGQGVKASGERESVRWLAALAAQFEVVDGSLFARHRSVVARSLVAWYDVLYNSGVVLTPEQYREQRRHCIRCCRSYGWLAYNAKCEGRLEFKIVPKFHYWHELSLQARMLNPRYVQTYSGESMVGRIAQIWKRSLAGPFQNTVQRTLMRKYVLGWEADLIDFD